MKKTLLYLIIYLMAFPRFSYAAISANAAFEVRDTGSDTANAGCFVQGIGVKTVTAATDLVIDATTNTIVTSVTHSFVAGDVNKWMFITAGAYPWLLGSYRIESVAAGAATLNQSPGPVGTASGTYDLYAGVDRSQQNSPQLTFTTFVNAGGSTTVTFAGGYTPTTDDLGNCVIMTGGTNVTPGVYVIFNETSTTWTMDRSPATVATTNMAGAMGGAVASVGYVASLNAVSGWVVYVKNGGVSYPMIATINVAGGSVSVGSTVVTLIGYQTHRYPLNGDAPPTLIVNANSVTMFAGSVLTVNNFILDGAGTGSGTFTGSKLAASVEFIGDQITRFNTASTGATVLVANQVFANSASISSTAGAFLNEFYGNTATPFIGSQAIRNISHDNSGATTDCIVVSTAGVAINNSGYNCGRFGISATAGGPQVVINNYMEGMGTAGYSFSSPAKFAFSNYGFNNPTLVTPAALSGYFFKGFFNLTSSAYTNAAGGVFTLNNTAGAGLTLRAAAYQSLFPLGLTANALDIGASQHADPSGGGGGTVGYPTMGELLRERTNALVASERILGK